MTVITSWSYAVGKPPYQVTAYERPDKRDVVYLRWRARTANGTRNWKKESLGFALRHPRTGRMDAVRQDEAQAAANRKHAELLSEADTQALGHPLSLREGLLRVTNPKTGRYPVDTAHRREVERALQDAIALWGADRRWDSLRKADLRSLWRRRFEQLQAKGVRGLRGAEVTIARVLTVAEWLRGEELIPPDACLAPRHWKQELASDWRQMTEALHDYEPERPRYTIDQTKRLLAVAGQVDPRYELLQAIGTGLRPGQVVRALRSDVDLAAGTVKVHPRGKKRGTVVQLTPGERRTLQTALTSGYLAKLEAAGGDFPLFPQGQLKGGRKHENPHAVERHRTAKPVNGRTLHAWHRRAEVLAKIPRVEGRSTYGIRRAVVDAANAEKVSVQGLKELGGWSDTQVPNDIYADRESALGRDEAAGVRARLRGERDP